MDVPESDALPVASTPTWTWTLSTRTAEANRKLEAAAQASVNWGVKHERQIQDFEAELASALSNSRAVHNLLVEALGSIEANRQRVDRALTQHIPHIYHELSNTSASLTHLSSLLPELRQQVTSIRAAYDSGRSKALALSAELEWEATPVQEKVLRIAFRPGEAPVRRREVWVVRGVLLLVLSLLLWQLAAAVDGAYRAYRHRLVWGDKLIS